MEDASTSHVGDDTHELENVFILQLPPVLAEKLQNKMANEPETVKDFLGIKFNQSEQVLRSVSVRLDNERLSGTIYDLPCVLELLKTIDKKSFYKVQDVSQMLVVNAKEPADNETTKSEPAPDPDIVTRSSRHRPDKEDMPTTAPSAAAGHNPANPSTSTNETHLGIDVNGNEEYEYTDDVSTYNIQRRKDREYRWPHGVTAPLKNVRRRRFRKTIRKQFMDPPELEKQLKRLLREDMMASEVRWEAVSKTAKQQSPSQDQSLNVSQAESDTTAAVGALTNTIDTTTLDESALLAASLFSVNTQLPSFPIPCISPSKLKESDVFGEALSSDSSGDDDNP